MQQLVRKQKPKLWPLLFLVTGLLFIFYPIHAGADDNTADSDETPAFSSPAQAQRAENLAAMTATEPDEDALNALNEANEKAATRDAAQEHYDAMVANFGADSPEAKQALAELEAAENAYAAAQQAADEKMAEFAGVSVEEIEAMRAESMGWGEIAHELGIHPGALGLGHSNGTLNRHRKAKMKGYTDEGMDEIQSATARNLETGWSKGHGKHVSDHSGGKGAEAGKSSSNGKSNKDKGNGKNKDNGGGKNK